MENVPQLSSEGRPPLSLCDNPLPQLYWLNETPFPDCLEGDFATALAPCVASNIVINWGHRWERTVHELALQVPGRETVHDLRRIGNKVLMSDNGSETCSFASNEANAEVAMRAASPEVNGIGEYAVTVLILFGIELDSLSEPLPSPVALPHSCIRDKRVGGIDK